MASTSLIKDTFFSTTYEEGDGHTNTLSDGFYRPNPLAMTYEKKTKIANEHLGNSSM
jgi:hypothetical protein